MAENRRRRDGGRRRRAPRAPVTERVDGGLAELVPDPERPRGWTLLVDGAPQSHVDLDEPAFLDFAYQRRLGHAADLVAPPGRPVRALHLGGGALTLARYIAATRPRSTQRVAEVDEPLVRLVRRELPPETGWRIRVRNLDARDALADLPEGWADLVIADVFSGATTPAHLTTAEFLAEVRRVLRPGGIYAANITDGRPLAHLRSQTATALSAFAPSGEPETAGGSGAVGRCCLTADPVVLRGRRFGNGVLLASGSELPLAELVRRTAGDPHPGRVLHGRELSDFTGGAPVVTDATARPSPPPPDGAFR